MNKESPIIRVLMVAALAGGTRMMIPPSPATAALRSESQTSQLIEKTIATIDNLSQAGIELGPEVEVQWYGNHPARVHRLNSGLETVGLALELDSTMLKGNLFRLSAETAGTPIVTKDLGPQQIRTLAETFPEKVPFFFIDAEVLGRLPQEIQDALVRAQNVIIRTGQSRLRETTFITTAGFLARWELGAEDNLFPSTGNALSFLSGYLEIESLPPSLET